MIHAVCRDATGSWTDNFAFGVNYASFEFRAVVGIHTTHSPAYTHMHTYDITHKQLHTRALCTHRRHVGVHTQNTFV